MGCLMAFFIFLERKKYSLRGRFEEKGPFLKQAEMAVGVSGRVGELIRRGPLH